MSGNSKISQNPPVESQSLAPANFLPRSLGPCSKEKVLLCTEKRVKKKESLKNKGGWRLFDVQNRGGEENVSNYSKLSEKLLSIF